MGIDADQLGLGMTLLHHLRDRVFLLSTTHGAETHALAAGLATVREYRRLPVIETLHARGERLRAGVEASAAALQRAAAVYLRPETRVVLSVVPKGRTALALEDAQPAVVA